MTAANKQPVNRRQWVLAALAEYETRLARYANRLLRDEQAAQDAVQHAFLRLCDETPETLNGRLAPGCSRSAGTSRLIWREPRVGPNR